MNLGTFFGFIIAMSVFIGSVVLSFSNVKAIIDVHAAFIVLGGTVAVALICFPLRQITNLLKVFFKRILGKNKRDYQAVIREVVALSEAKIKGPKAFESALENISDPFLKDGGQVLFWMNAEISLEELRDLLETRVSTHYNLYMDEAKVFKTMAKFPPAFGLMGTTMGMIALLQSLGNANSKGMIGPAMAIALVATLYGLVMTNFVFTPIAENLVKQTKEDMLARNIALEGIMLIAADKPTGYVEEKIKSFILPDQRGEPITKRRIN